MTIYKDIRILVNNAINTALKILENKKITSSAYYNNGKKDVPTIQSEVITVTKENFKSEVIESGYYSKVDFKWQY